MAGYIGKSQGVVLTSVNTDTVETQDLQDASVTTAKIATQTGNINFADDAKAVFGAGSDLQIYHDGSNSYIDEVGTGSLYIDAENFVLRNNGDNGKWINAYGDTVNLLYNDSVKLSTTTAGIDVTGTATMDGAEIAKASSMTQLKLERTTTAAGSGYLGASADHCLVAQDSAGLYRAAVHQNGDLSLYEDTGTTAKFFWDASAESLTLNSTLKVEGGTTNGFIQSSGSLFQVGASTASDLVAYTNNTERMRISASGNVGIGVTSPNEKLTVAGNIELYNDDTDGYIWWHDYGTRSWSLGSDQSTGSFVLTQSSNITSSEKLVVSGSGYVGIGTSSPVSLLHVANANGDGFEFLPSNTTDTNWIQSYDRVNNSWVNQVNAALSHQFYISGSERMRIDSSGRVGINRTPSISNSKLEVGGADNVPLINVEASGVTGGMGIGSTGLQFFHGSSAHMRITSSGNVGIGTSSPEMRLDVAGDILINNNAYLYGENSVGSNSKLIGRASDDTLYIGDTAFTNPIILQNGNNFIGFKTNATERMRIDSSGNVGIGTSSPSSALDVNGTVTIASGQKIRSTSSSGYIRMSGGATYSGGSIELNGGNGDNNIEFYTDNGSQVQTERGRIDSNGGFLWGTTSRFSGGSPANLELYGHGFAVLRLRRGADNGEIQAFYNSANSQVGYIAVDGSSTSYSTSSDYRLKTDVQPMTGATERIKALNPVNFEWISNGTRTDGFLAHEAQEVVPEAVTGEKDAVDDNGDPVYQGIDQSKLVPLLTAALQEALARIDTLEAEVTALKGA